MGALLSEPVTAMVVDRTASRCMSVASVTMQGWRKTHEDSHILCCTSGGAASAAAGDEDVGVFAVLDGHGGHVAAQVATVLLQDRLVGLARTPQAMPDAASTEKKVQHAFLEADELLRDQLEDKSGSTVVAAVITRPRPGQYVVRLAHCGDSRAVLCTSGGLICTLDHKPGRQDEADRIRAAGGSVEHGPLGGPLRVDGALAVSRALGDFHFKSVNMDPAACKVTALPEVQVVEKCTDGDWLLLACDGVFDVMENEEVQEFISSRIQQESNGAPVDGGKIMVELLRACLDKGSKDNCTACLVQLGVPSSNGAEGQPSRELIQGPWNRSPPDVQAKYAEFFSAHGFETEAKAVQKSAGRSDMRSHSNFSDAQLGPGSLSSPAAAAAGTPSASPGPRQLATLARALQAMRSSRAIQGAWRARRSVNAAAANGGNAGSGAGGSSGDGAG
mmetsp:Transcript_16714/g.32266  ORF Transcript_16714/g.32266 Transcript_16714/m.32266 type:complete len:446 (-) Transcript_16714:4-1341(-)